MNTTEPNPRPISLEWAHQCAEDATAIYFRSRQWLTPSANEWRQIYDQMLGHYLKIATAA